MGCVLEGLTEGEIKSDIRYEYNAREVNALPKEERDQLIPQLKNLNPGCLQNFPDSIRIGRRDMDWVFPSFFVS